MSNSHSFCLYSRPNEQGFTCLLNTSNGADTGSDFIFAPFDAGRGPLIFHKPENRTFTSVEEFSNWAENNLNTHHVPLNSAEVTRASFIENVEQAISLFKADFQKVIVARNKLINKPNDFDSFNFFGKLIELHPDKFCYLFSSEDSGTWMGASPELLLKQMDKDVRTMSLAGTTGIHSKNWSGKELDEQAIVTRSIVSELTKLGCENIKLDNPHVVKAGPVSHLRTNVSGILTSNTSPTLIAEKLHPTPAISGYPKSDALSFISKTEQFDRAFYSGYLGEISAKHADLYVNLRCMHVGANKIELFAGAGITSESKPENEYLETEAKLSTLLSLLK